MVQNKFIFAIIFCIHFSSANRESFKDIIKQIKEHEFDPYEIYIIHCEEEEYPKFQEELLRATHTASPTKVIAYKRKDNRIISPNLPKLHRSSLQSILYIVILKGESLESEKDRLLSYLYSQSKIFTPPRYLVMIINRKNDKKKDYKNLYDKAWKQFHVLHLTFLEIDSEENCPRTSISKTERNITIHQYNPFSQNYHIEQYKQGVTIFPKYLKNLHGLNLKSMTVHSGPLTFDKTLQNDSINYTYSAQTKVLNFIATELNFTIEYRKKPFCKALVQQEIGSLFKHNDIIANNLPITSINGTQFGYCFALNMRRKNYKLLLSIQRTMGESQTELQTSFTIGLVTFSLVCLTWTILCLLKCDGKITQPLNFIGLLLGNTIDVNVVRIKDRILFLSILMGFWLFSSTLYSILTDVKIVSNHTDSVNSLKDLQDLNLIVYFSSDFIPLVADKKNSTLINMFRKKKIVHNDKECIDFLVNNVHVVCLIEENIANNAVFNSIDETGLPRLKVLGDFNLDLHTAIHFKKSSPFVFVFEMYVQKLEQMGLISKWNQDVPRIEEVKNKGKNVPMYKSVSTTFKLLFVLIVGYGLSIIVFVGEFVVKHHEESELILFALLNGLKPKRCKIRNLNPLIVKHM